MDVSHSHKRRAQLPLQRMHHMSGQTNLGDVPAQEPPKPVSGPEYDPFEAGDFVADWLANFGAEMVGPIIDLSKVYLPAEKYHIFNGRYGNTLRTRLAIYTANTGADLLAGPLSNMIRKALHNVAPGIAGEPKPGLGIELPETAPFIQGLIKTVSTGMAKTWVTNINNPYKPPPPKPKPGDPPPPPPPTPPDAKKGPMLLGKDLKALANESASYGLSIIISKVYDQTVGPMVNRAVYKVLGKDVKELPKPKPMTPGGIVSAMGSAFFAGLIMRPVEWPSTPEGAAASGKPFPGAGVGSVIGTGLMNGLISAAFDMVYDRSVGPSISDAVNGLAGIEKEQRDPGTYTAERLVRSVARSTVAGSAYYITDAATRGFFSSLGASIGGPFGGFLALAGSAIVGMTAGTVADSILGGTVGSIAGSLYSMITGHPKSEHRPPAPPALPPNGNPGPVGPIGTPAALAAGTPAAAPAGTTPAPAGTPPVVPTVTAGLRRKSQEELLAEMTQHAIAS